MLASFFVLIIAATFTAPTNAQCLPESFQYDEDFVRSIILPHVAVTYGSPMVGLANAGLQRYEVDNIFSTNLTGPIGNYFAFISRSDEDKRYIVAFSGITNQTQMDHARDEMHAPMVDIHQSRLILSKADSKERIAVFPVSWRAYESFRDVGLSSAIRRVLNDPTTSDYAVMFAGLSFGGTQAMIAGYMFSDYAKKREANIITIGSPKVGNKAFSEHVNRNYPNAIRVVYNCDGVVASPMCLMNTKGRCRDPKSEYHHAGVEVFYRNFKQPYQICGRDQCQTAATCSAGCSFKDLLAGIQEYHRYYFDRWVGHWGETNLVEMWPKEPSTDGQCIAKSFLYDDDFVQNIILPHLAVTYGNPAKGLASVGLQRYKVHKQFSTKLSGPIGNYFAFISRSDEDMRYIVAFSGVTNQSQVEYIASQKYGPMKQVSQDEKVFSPFMVAYKSFLSNDVGFIDAIHEIIDNADTKDYEIIFAGFSFGGSMAVIAGYDFANKLVLNLKRTANIITVGAPKAGNKAFTDYVNHNYPNSIRVVYDCDGIVAFPLCKPNKSGSCMDNNQYYHTGTEVFHKSSTKTYEICGGTPCGEDDNCNSGCSMQDLVGGAVKYLPEHYRLSAVMSHLLKQGSD